MGLLDIAKGIDKKLKEGQKHRKQLRAIEKDAFQKQQLEEARRRGVRRAKQWGSGTKSRSGWGSKIVGGLATAGKTYNDIGKQFSREADALYGTKKKKTRKRKSSKKKKRKTGTRTLTIRY